MESCHSFIFAVPDDEFAKTEDGFDTVQQTNYLSPFLLTHLLLREYLSVYHNREIQTRDH